MGEVLDIFLLYDITAKRHFSLSTIKNSLEQSKYSCINAGGKIDYHSYSSIKRKLTFINSLVALNEDLHKIASSMLGKVMLINEMKNNGVEYDNETKN